MKFETDYAALSRNLDALVSGVPYLTANLANTSALLWQMLPGLNWAGFYQLMEGENALVLGPFQGKPACIRIPMGRGVCGTAAEEGRKVRVENVHDFPGHIACDSASNSELVIPLYRQGKLWGVLDLDSPHFGRFAPEDQAGLEEIAKKIESFL